MGDKTRVVKETCEGCGWISGSACRAITEPRYFHEKGGGCFAKTSRERALEIERQIEESKTFSKKRRRRA